MPLAGRRRDLSKGITVAVALTIIGSAVAWIPAGWMATRWNWPVPGWQIGFAIFWLLPSVLLTALLIIHGKLAGYQGDAI